MAKVYGPAHSDDARGKLAKAIVFMGWKGIKTARQWLVPKNPELPYQGNMRTIIGATGRAVGKISKDGAYAGQLVTLKAIPPQQSKQSRMVQFIKDNYFPGQKATLKTNYGITLAEFNGHTAVDDWNDEGAAFGLSDFGMVYDDITDYPKGMGLYLIAKAAIALSFTGAPYNIALEDWVLANIQLLVTHMKATV